MKYGLLGRSLTHSYSPNIHRLLGNLDYKLIEMEPQMLEAFLRQRDFLGLNVTIPYKKAVIPYLDELTDTAKRLGTVNTIIRRHDGTLLGHNSDYYGFSELLNQSGLSVENKKCLVLGNGGAAATVVALLQNRKAHPVVISRNGVNNYSNLWLHEDAQIIINATPVGMFPNCGQSPIDLSLFPNLQGVVDLVYNPLRTKFLLDAEDREIPAFNGLWMLAAQAKESAEWFQNTHFSQEITQQVYGQILSDMENIVLIGMPGCGKSTVGSQLAAVLNRPFVDTDDKVQLLAGKTIQEIFEKEGEAVFRQLETSVLEKYGQKSGLVIATGGGCVTRKENWPLIHQNGRIFYLHRDLSLLPTDGRPLSVNLQELYCRRSSLYRQFADHYVDNNGTIDRSISQILEVIHENSHSQRPQY